MTKEQIQAIIKKYPDAKSFIKPSHLEELSPLVEAHVEAVIVKKENFHNLGSGTYYPKKETTDRFGNAAGISFARVETSIKREGDAYICMAVPQEVGPDGKMVQWAPAVYEFDPEVRAEEDALRNPEKYKSDSQKRLKYLEYKKTARRRADTGARVAAIISAIGMPTGLKNIFQQNDPPSTEKVFLFSRIIVNTKNEMVLNRALDSMFGATQALYGGGINTSQIAAPKTQESPRDVTGSDNAFDDFDMPDSNPQEDPERSSLIQGLNDYLNSGILPERGYQLVSNALADIDNQTNETLRDLVDRCRRVESGQGATA